MDEMVAKSESEEVDGLDAIIEGLSNTRNRIPIEAIEAARQNRERITPLLIRLIENATRDCRQGLVVQNNGHYYATYLLAEFEETEAWPVVLAAVSLPGEKPFDLYGTAIGEDFACILGALVGDRTDALDALIADPQINSYVRWQAAEAMLYQIRAGVLSRDSVVERLTGHLKKAVEDGVDDLEGIVMTLGNLGAESALPVIESAFEAGLVEPYSVTLEEIQEQIGDGGQDVQSLVEGMCRPDELIDRLCAWATFFEEVEVNDEDDLDVLDDEDDLDAFHHEDELDALPSSPSTAPDEEVDDDELVPKYKPIIRNESIKIGRNEKCPCGSGKKYKKCCGRK